MKGSSNAFVGPGSSPAAMEGLPDSRVKMYDEAFVLTDENTGELLVNYPYRIKRADGTYEEGFTDDNGRTHLILTAEPEEISIEVPYD